MQLQNVEKIKKNINIELENRINNHKKNYYLQLNLYNNRFLKSENHIKGKSTLDREDNYNIEDKGKILFTHIEDKSIKGHINKDINIISYAKLEYNNFKRCKFKDIIFKSIETGYKRINDIPNDQWEICDLYYIFVFQKIE